MKHWVTSDHHFGHFNIIKYGERPFKDLKEMDEALVDQWNIYVKPEDHIYHLGDVTIERGGKVQQDAFIRLIKRLNGHKRLIMGNHDHFPIKTYWEAGFEKVVGSGQWWGNGLILSHYPIHPDHIGYRALGNVHGHIHQNPSPPIVTEKSGKRHGYINVCVEVTNYHPVEVDEVLERMRKMVKE